MSNESLAKRALELFDSVLDLPESEWPAFIDQACAGQPDLRLEVQKLLAAHARAEGMLEGAGGAADWVQAETAPEAPASAQQVVGPYRLIKEIGRGGMGVVHLAQDSRLGRRVALKFLSPALTADVRGRARLEAEARAVGRLDHPNICGIYDLDETADGRLYIAMPYYRGRTLAEMLDDEPMAVERAVDLVRQAALGLECAHEAGVIHRDIKPGNLLVTTDGEVKILDFGVAKLAGLSLSEPGMRVGTLSYMAPEQALGEDVQASTDLWSLGVTLYELIGGQRPFRGDYEPALIYEILHGEPVPLRRVRPEIPQALDRIIRKLLAKTVAGRYEGARELLDDLEAWDRSDDVVLRDDVPHNLPAPLTSLVGRTEELRKVERLLETNRLLTVTGPAGVGKTRVAIEAARRMLGRFPDGVWYTSLAAIQDHSAVMETIGASLGLEMETDAEPGQAIRARLRDSTTLLVLDNFEHVTEAASGVLGLLAECAGLRVMAVSRAPLGLSGEQEMAVGPLEGPAPGAGLAEAAESPAVALFVERARAVRPELELTETNVEAVTGLCAELDGSPLALELAASRVKLFSPQALLARLGRRLDIVAAAGGDLPERHRSLRSAIQWSYDLLDDDCARLFRHLAVFAGGGSLESAAAVAEVDEIAAADALQTLAAHHLVRVAASPEGDPLFEITGTMRRFAFQAAEAEGELAAARRRHAEWYLRLAERARPMLTGSEQLAWIGRLEAAHGNFGLAMDWASEQQEASIGLALAASLRPAWVARGRTREGFNRLEEVLALPRDGVSAVLVARALHGYAVLATILGRNSQADQARGESLTIWRSVGDDEGLAEALNTRARVRCELSELQEAERVSREALALHVRADDKHGQALSWNNLGWVAGYRADYEAATAAFTTSVALSRACSDRRGEGYALACLAWTEQWHGDAKRAHKLLDEASRILLPTADPLLLGWAFTVRALTLLWEGRLDEACEIVEKASREWNRGASLAGAAWVLTVRGTVELRRGHAREADERLGEAAGAWRRVGCGWGLATALGEKARALVRRGKIGEAKRALAESLELRRSIGDRRGMAHGLETAAELGDDAEQAELLRGAAVGLRREIGALETLGDLQPPLLPVPPASISTEDALEIAGAIAGPH